MLDLPWGTLLAGGGPWAIITITVISIIRGWLVPSATVTLLMQRAEEWRTAWEKSEEARRVQAEQVAQLLEFARTADAVFRSLPSPNSASSTREPAS